MLGGKNANKTVYLIYMYMYIVPKHNLTCVPIHLVKENDKYL